MAALEVISFGVTCISGTELKKLNAPLLAAYLTSIDGSLELLSVTLTNDDGSIGANLIPRHLY